MPNAAVIAAALTDHSAHPWGLFVGSSDVIGMTSLETIRLTEEGPGGVSSMEFTIDDPGKAVSIVDGAEVSFWDLTGNVVYFRGTVASWTARPEFGGQGRTITVECDGI